MKLILLIGGALMAGAGIYGFVDYKKASHRKEFQSLYIEKKEEPKQVVQEPVIEQITPVPTDVPVYVVKNGKVVADKKPATTNKKNVKKKRKKVRFQEFSRAAIEEEIVLPEPAESQSN